MAALVGVSQMLRHPDTDILGEETDDSIVGGITPLTAVSPGINGSRLVYVVFVMRIFA